VLRNLKNIYMQDARLENALAVMHRMLLVVPESAEELRDRACCTSGSSASARRCRPAELRAAPAEAPDVVDVPARSSSAAGVR